MFLTAPIATRARLTLYYQLEKICGRQLVTLYNLANGVMFCFLAGAMITVSATAVGVLVRVSHAGPERHLSQQRRLGAGRAGGRCRHFDRGGLRLRDGRPRGQHRRPLDGARLSGLRFRGRCGNSSTATEHGDPLGGRRLGVWPTTAIWRGGEPLPGQVKFTFWHVMFFAWFCNMAMHIGMSDLSVFRFARKSWYGVASAAGMYVGHFMAWIAASMLFAYQLHAAGLTNTERFVRRPPTTSSRAVARAAGLQACGIAGLICVIVAGWTTANPTIYRAGSGVSGDHASVLAVRRHPCSPARSPRSPACSRPWP